MKHDFRHYSFTSLFSTDSYTENILLVENDLSENQLLRAQQLITYFNENAQQIILKIDELSQNDFDDADVVIIGVSSAGVDWYIDLLKKYKAQDKKFLIITKGLFINDQNSIDILPNKILSSVPYPINITAVAGPCKAIELAQQYITNICFINQNIEIAARRPGSRRSRVRLPVRPRRGRCRPRRCRLVGPPDESGRRQPPPRSNRTHR